MSGLWVRVWLYTAALATGASFCILFGGNVSGSFASASPAAALGAFGVMFGAALVAVVVGSAGKFRFVLIFPAAALYTLLAVYGTIPIFSLSGWKALFSRVASDALAGANTMYGEPIPYDLLPGLLIVLIPIVMIVVTFAVSATLYEDSPIFSVAVLGITIAILSTISFEDGAGPFFVTFLVCAIALLLSVGSSSLDSDGSAASGTVSRLAWPSVVAGVVVAVVVLVLPRAPLADQTLSEGAIDWTRIGAGSTSTLDVQADVGDYLTSGENTPILKVASDEELFWRAGTLDRFDGVRWEDTTAPGEDDGEEISSDIETRSVNQIVTILEAETDLVFGGYRITEVVPFEGAPPAFESSDSSWRTDRPIQAGDTYEVNSEIPQPTEEQLRAAGSDYPAEVRDRFLQMPDSTPGAVADTAQKIENRYDGSPTEYDKARNIESYLLRDGGFTYNLDVNYQRADKAIEEFLAGEKEGFCTQFATSMALLTREEGIPSRVVYGTTTGDPTDNPGEYLVKGSNVHTWVEVYFPGVGWYPFDPTPGFEVPTTMQANAPRPEPEAQNSQEPGVTPGSVEQRERREDNANNDQQQNDPRNDQEKKDAAASDGGGGLPLWPLLALLPVGLVAAVPVVKKLLASRGRPEDLYRDLIGRGRDLSPPGRGAVADSPALTPNERMLLLAGALGVEEEPFREFGRAYTDHLYSGAGHKARGRDVSTAYRRSTRVLGSLPLWRRVLGAVNPASLVARAGRGVAGLRGAVAKKLARRRG